MRPLSCLHGCTIPDAHVTDDPTHPVDDDCSGCLTARPAPGLHVCAVCEKRVRDGLRDFPALWADLGEPIRGKRSGSGSNSQDLDVAMHTRHSIRALLVAWCLTLEEDDRYRITPPIGRGNGQPANVRAMAHHVAVQAGRLLDDPVHADQLVHDVGNLAGQAWSIARPSSGREFTIECDCGRRVAIDPEPGVWMICRECGSKGVLSWWIEHSAPDVQSVTIAGAPAVLWDTYRMRVTSAQLEGWAKRGKIVPDGVEEREGPGVRAATYPVRKMLRLALDANDTKARRAS